jgi:hypothetical protein
MSNPTPGEHVQNLLNEQTRLLANKAILTEQLAEVDKRLAGNRAALEGVQLGQALAAQEGEVKTRQAADAAAAEAALEALKAPSE